MVILKNTKLCNVSGLTGPFSVGEDLNGGVMPCAFEAVVSGHSPHPWWVRDLGGVLNSGIKKLLIKINIPNKNEDTCFLDRHASLAMTHFPSSLRGAKRRSNPGFLKCLEYRILIEMLNLLFSESAINIKLVKFSKK
jgi:hypothetical protein